MKVIFLDVDGVLNCNATKERIGNFIFVDNQKIEYLKEIVECTNAKIVLSSTWRLGWIRQDGLTVQQDNFFEALKDRLLEHELDIYDRTPDLNGVHRGREIDAWIKANKNIESFVILDDDSDMDEHRGRLVKTRWYAKGAGGGLLKKHVRVAIDVLNRPYRENKDEKGRISSTLPQ